LFALAAARQRFSSGGVFMSARSFSIRAATGVSALLLLVAGCGGSNNNPTTGPGPGGPTIHIVTNAMSKGSSAYSPNPDTVSVNTTVTWKNDDSITHTVTGSGFNLTIGAGGTSSHQFASAGSFPYQCTISGHTMTGTLVVTP
jgi:plastocyanin